MSVRKWVSNLVQSKRGEPDWATVLQIMHRSEPPEELRDQMSTSPVHTVGLIADIANMDYSRVHQASARLQDWGLVNLQEYEVTEGESTMKAVEFTDDGFAVAHERQLSKQQNQINHSLALFTLVLVILNGVDILTIEENLQGVVVSILLIGAAIHFYGN